MPKGKLFGRLKAIDVVIILLVLAAIGGLFAKAILGSKISQTAQAYVVKDVQIQILAADIYPAQAEAIKPGAAVIESHSGIVLGAVKDVQITNHFDRAADAQGNYHWSGVPGKRDAVISVAGKVKTYNGFFEVGEAYVAAGAKLDIASPAFVFSNVNILKVEGL
jgi:hypothetical protein